MHSLALLVGLYVNSLVPTCTTHTISLDAICIPTLGCSHLTVVASILC